MSEFLSTDIQFLKGVGENRARILKTELGIGTFEDLLQYYPFRYEDRTQYTKISDIDPESGNIQIKGRILSKEESGFGKNVRLVAEFTDGEDHLELVWFKGVKWIIKSLPLNQDVVIYGKPSKFKGKLNIAHPEVLSMAEAQMNSGLFPVYSLTENMRNSRIDSKVIRTLVSNIIQHEKWSITEPFNDQWLVRLKLIKREQAFKTIHLPNSIN